MVKILGKPAFETSDDERRKIFGYVEQSFHMIPGTVRDQITLSDRSITENQIQTAIHISGLDEAISQLEHGLDTICTPEIFSQGQWQLLSIARAVVAEPKILLLDEPVSGLDPRVTAEMYQLIKDLNKKDGITIIMISHDIAAAVKYATHILHIGEHCFFGTKKQYLESSLGKAFTGQEEEE